MTYRSLLVLLDHDPLCSARTECALQLAKDLGCHLVGVAPTSLVDMPSSPEAAASLAELAARVWDTLRAQAEQATQTFACRTAGLASFEAVVDEADKAPSLIHHAHCSDLTLLSQADPASPNFRATKEMVEQVVLHSARPTLILPYAMDSGRFDRIGTQVLVAWDDSREAARAIADALPLLRRAARVQVISWQKADEGSAAAARLDALRRWLMWQGVVAEVQVDTTPIDIAGTMLSRAADMNADLIVMGAYGHARWTEWALGGATRGMLESMTVPVLMSH
jgi:nucleotide-binding universal stress UspA family protein